MEIKEALTGTGKLGRHPRVSKKFKNIYKDNKFSFEEAILDCALFPLLWTVHSTKTQLEGVLPNASSIALL